MALLKEEISAVVFAQLDGVFGCGASLACFEPYYVDASLTPSQTPRDFLAAGRASQSHSVVLFFNLSLHPAA
jgi:hypothetical protein